MPRRRFWKKSLAKKTQAVLRTDVTEDTVLDKNSIRDIDLTEDTGLVKNSEKADLTIDVTEDTGLGKNSEKADCEDTVLLKTVSTNLEQNFEQTIEQTIEQSIKQSIEQTIKQTIEQTIKQSVEQSIEQSVEQTNIEQSVEQTNIEQSVEQTNIDQTNSDQSNVLIKTEDEKIGGKQNIDKFDVVFFEKNTEPVLDIPIQKKCLRKTNVQKSECRDMKYSKDIRRNKRRKSLYNIMLITAKYDRLRRKKAEECVQKPSKKSSRKRIVKKQLYNILLITAKSDRKKRKIRTDEKEDKYIEQVQEKSTLIKTQQAKKTLVKNANAKCVQAKCMQRQKLPANVMRIRKNFVVVTERNSQHIEKPTACNTLLQNKSKRKKVTCKNTIKPKEEKHLSDLTKQEKITPKVQKNVTVNIHEDTFSEVDHKTKKPKRRIRKLVDRKSTLVNSEKPKKISVSSEMKKKVEERIEELSEMKLGQEITVERSNVQGKAKSNNVKKDKNLQTVADKDVIFEKQSGPVVYPFQQLSSHTKQKLMIQMGMRADIVSPFRCEAETLGKPVSTKSILGDGNCFFRALSFAVSGEENHHMLIRKAVVHHMMKCRNKFKTHLRCGYKSVPEYLSKKCMLHDGIWATEVEILAAAHLFGTNIYIYEEVLSSWQLFSPNQVDKTYKVEQEGIYLVHRHHTHYDVVLTVEEAVPAVELQKSKTCMARKEHIVLCENEYSKEKKHQIYAAAKHVSEFVTGENVNFKKEIVQGSFHQGHSMFSENAGKQCVLNSLSALLHSREKCPSLWTPFDLDHVLVKGDEMYGFVRRSSSMNYDYLSIPEIPRLIEYSEDMFQIEFQDSLSGTLGNIQDFDQYQFVTMYEALYLALDQHEIQGAFVTFKGNTFIVIKHTVGYFVIDSHSRNRAGLQVPDGKSLLKYFQSIPEVYDHCINLAVSMGYLPQDMFEVTAVCAMHDEVNLISQTDEETILKTSSLTAENKERHNASVVEADELLNSSHKKQSATLLDKYFHYQENMNKQKLQSKKQSCPKSDKKKYMRNYMKKRRENQEFKIIDRRNTIKSMSKARQSKEFCEQEYEAQKAARQDPEMKSKNKQSALRSKRKARESKMFYDGEVEAKRLKRNDPLQLECERLYKKESRKRHRIKEKETDQITKSIKRRKLEFSEHEDHLSRKRLFGSNILDCIKTFHEKAAVGPVFVCTCCHQTWFSRSVVKLCNINISEDSKAYCTGLISHDNEEWLCRTCLASLKKDKIPKLSEQNGFKWPTKPDVLQLHPLEERLISQRIPFMQIRELPRGGQLSAKGNIVNVPVDIQPTVNALPRQMDEHVTIAVKLKKRLSHKSACFTENVRPNVVMNALEWLMENSEMYRNAGITINSTWKEDMQNNENELISEYMGKSLSKDNREVETPDDEFCEVSAEECIQGNSDTLVDETNTDTNKVYVFAPGENQRPLSLYDDKDAEYLCFPTIFCGQRRKENSERQTPVHYSDIAKWELRSVDRRAAHSVPNIFFKLKKIQTKQVSDKVNLALRRCKSDGKKLTAGQVKDSATTNEIVRLNEGYYIFRTLRNSPAYLSSKKKDVFAMIRQLGLPTWFMSLSSADTKWSDLLKTLAQLDGKILSENDLATADWNFKTNLVKKDPVTCARFFDNRVQLFVNTVLKSHHNPIGDITDVFRRVEFQNRGSPHIHMLLWANDAPKYPDDDEKTLIEYVDNYVTCSLQTDNPDMKELVELQIHKHSKTCKKGGKPVCRFGFPLPPLQKTMLLEPLETNVSEYKQKYTQLQKKMNELKDGCDLSFYTFLQTVVQMDEEEYVKCIRASLKSPKIFLKRTPAEMRVNYYNPDVLKAWRANLDIQFVLDPYACATYIVSYISKSQRGISALLEKASQEAVEGNMDLKHQVRHIGNKFLNFVEVSAQEASYLILQMPLTQSTRDVVFINTSPPDERVFLLKSQDDLENLPEDSTDIKADNMITRYAKRPKQLENWCLADVVSELEMTFPKELEKEQRESGEQNEDNLQNMSDDEDFSPENIVVHLKNGIKIRRRNNKRVVRYVGYSKRTNSEQHYRERIFLFLPWRNENIDILGGHETYEQHYKSKANIIQSLQKKYEHFVEELEQARLQAEGEVEDFDDIAPNTEHAEAEDEQIGCQPSEQFVHFDPDSSCHRDYDIGPDIGLPAKNSDVQTSPNRISDEKYHKLLQSLNCKQREFHNHVTHWIKHKDQPLYTFLTGGAGTGKSVVINAIYQTLHRVLCSEEGEDPDDVRILLCAYTGKAAFNINGMTIASAFHKKIYQTQQNMYADELNTFRSKYRNLSVIIIDEISMVGNKLLAFIHERLQQLTGTKQDFGGISIIAVGDLYQLSPVGDAWIFKDLSCPGQGLAKNLWKEHFTMFELHEIMRQKDDIEFSKLLNRLRHNELTDEDKQIISTRIVEAGAAEYPTSAPHLFIENKFVDDFNNKFMENLVTNKVDVKADTDVLSQTKLSLDVKKCLIQNLPDKQVNTGQLKTNLTIAVDMIYDISVNIDVTDGLTNGSTCVVKHIEYKGSLVRPAIVWVLFADDNVGAVRRQQYKHLYSKKIENNWTPIFETKRTFMYNRKTFERIQFPFQPSAAKTVHKAQGATLNQVVVSLSQTKRRKIPHIHYVALSRVRSLQNLHIIDFNAESLSKDKGVDEEMQRLAKKGLQLCFTPLYDTHMQGQFLFNNARSLHRHILDIQSEPNVLAAHVVGIAESRLYSNDPDDKFEFEGFKMFRNDALRSQSRPYHGIVVYVKSHIDVTTHIKFSTDDVEFSFLSLILCESLVQCAVVYKKPACKLSHFYDVINENLVPLINVNEKIIIMGDFNVDLMKDCNNTFLKNIETTFQCTQIITQPTTKADTQLDLIFTNFSDKTSGVLEAYWSDHNMIYCAASIQNPP